MEPQLSVVVLSGEGGTPGHHPLRSGVSRVPGKRNIFEFPLPSWSMGWSRGSLCEVAARGDKECAGLAQGEVDTMVG